MLAACRTPDLVTEITLQPVRRHGVDGAIFFSDIVVPLHASGRPRHRPGQGAGRRRARSAPGPTSTSCPSSPPTPSRTSPSRSGGRRRARADAAHRLRGAPFTLASYLVEGGPSQEPRAHQGAHARRPGAVARPVRPPRVRSPGPSCGAGRGRGEHRPALRQLGRFPQPRRLRPPRPAALGGRAGDGRRPRRARRSTSGSAPASCSSLMAAAGPTSSGSTTACR
jgi:hypothetical protein